ncbi:MAG: septum formation initiator family protein [Candidatus Paceibacterota bacterium]
MRNFQEKNKFKKVVQSKIFLIIFGILIIFFTYNVFNLIIKMQDTIKNRKIVENKIKDLEKQKMELLINIDKLKTDKGIEENIREKFGLGKEGEGMIVVVDEKKENEEKEENSNSFFSRIINWFKQ